MALVGRMEDLELTELFHVLSLFKKSGSLTLRCQGKTGVFGFRAGKIVHAANGQKRPTLGNLLLERKLIDQQQLEAALEEQNSTTGWRKLGAILVERGLVSAERIEGLIREQLQAITEEFLHQHSGFFSFKPEDEEEVPAAGGLVGGAGEDIELTGGMNTDQFILELLTRLDEVDAVQGPRHAAQTEAKQALESTSRTDSDIRRLVEYMVDSALDSSSGATYQAVPETPEGLADLRSLMVEIQLRSPSFSGEVGLMIMRYASTVVDRGLLMHVDGASLSPIGQFGFGGTTDRPDAVERHVRSIRIPSHEPSVFLELLETMHAYRGPLRRCRWNDYLVDCLGGERPAEVVVIPIIVDGIIAAMFYGDNAPEHRPIGSVHGLELLAIEAGLAMERTLLRARLRSVETQLKTLGTDNSVTKPLATLNTARSGSE